jgi:thiamine biosynthesis lipoprotein
VLEFSGIAKGYAVDRVADRLRGLGCRHFLIEIGGELRGEGIKPDGQPWWVDLEAPPDARGIAPLRVALHQIAVATSGDYRRFYEEDGRRLAHSLDPRTGAPIVNAPASVTVLHDSAMLADALATAIPVLGPEAGMTFARQKALAVRLLTRRAGGGVIEHLSPALMTMLE